LCRKRNDCVDELEADVVTLALAYDIDAVAARYAAKFPAMKLSTIKDFGGWQAAQARRFADGGTFDKIYQPG
jgi:ABC-type sulfate transport system substrate-binding protein